MESGRKKSIRNALPFLGLVSVIVILEIASGGSLLTPGNVSSLVNEVFILITFNLLNVKYQKHNTDINVKNKYTISTFVILKMSPTR